MTGISVNLVRANAAAKHELLLKKHPRIKLYRAVIFTPYFGLSLKGGFVEHPIWT
jgi:hypothetical protein